jgi:hypothetical protein
MVIAALFASEARQERRRNCRERGPLRYLQKSSHKSLAH